MNSNKTENWLKLNGVLPQSLSHVSKTIHCIEEALNGTIGHNNFVNAVSKKDWTKAKQSADMTNIGHIGIYKKYMADRSLLLKEEVKKDKIQEMAKFKDMVSGKLKFQINENHLGPEFDNELENKKKVLAMLSELFGTGGDYPSSKSDSNFDVDERKMDEEITEKITNLIESGKVNVKTFTNAAGIKFKYKNKEFYITIENQQIKIETDSAVSDVIRIKNNTSVARLRKIIEDTSKKSKLTKKANFSADLTEKKV